MDDNWNQLTPDQRSEVMLRSWFQPRGVEFASAEAQASYRHRLSRIQDALHLKIPDRVPWAPTFGTFPAHYGRITIQEAMYDFDKAHQAWKHTMVSMDPELYTNFGGIYPGVVFDALGYKLMKWPGHGLPDNEVFQFVEGEYMQAEEYDDLLADPSDFMIRKYYPRIFGRLAPLAQLAPLRNGMWMEMLGLIASFGNPELDEALSCLQDAGRGATNWFARLSAFDREMQSLGYPCLAGGMSFAPFDLLGDTLRGTRGIMADMYRRPDKLLAAIDRLTGFAIEMGSSGGRASGNPFVWIYLHKGAAPFMSNDQFRTFYWPGLRSLIIGLIQEGMTPCVYTEGDYTPRLETIADVPPGKVIYHFEEVDLPRVHETLGGVACVSGNVPLSLLAMGTPEDVKQYCRQLISVLGRDGGFIMDSAAAINEARPENLIAMRDSCRG